MRLHESACPDRVAVSRRLQSWPEPPSWTDEPSPTNPYGSDAFVRAFFQAWADAWRCHAFYEHWRRGKLAERWSEVLTLFMWFRNTVASVVEYERFAIRQRLLYGRDERALLWQTIECARSDWVETAHRLDEERKANVQRVLAATGMEQWADDRLNWPSELFAASVQETQVLEGLAGSDRGHEEHDENLMEDGRCIGGWREDLEDSESFFGDGDESDGC